MSIASYSERAPAGWTSATLGEICQQFGGAIQTGPFGSQLHAADYLATGTPVVLPQDIVAGGISDRRVARVGPAHVAALSRHKLQLGDVIFSRRGDVCRFAVVSAREVGWLCGTGCLRVRIGSGGVEPNFAAWFWSQSAVRQWLERSAQGATMANLNTTILANLPIYFPALPEQRRIAALLDQADGIRRKRREALVLAESFLRSAFLEMFGDPVGNPRGWEVKPLAALTTKIGSGATPLGGDSAYKDAGVPLIRSLNVRDGRFKYKDLAFLDDQQALRLAGATVLANDVLLNITGASVARCCRAPESLAQARVNQHVAILRPRSTLTSEYLEHVLLAPNMKAKLLAAGEAGGATRQALTKAQLEALAVPVPPVANQQRFTELVRAHSAMVGRMELAAEEAERMFAGLVGDVFDNSP